MPAAIVSLDLHGCNVYQAKIALDSALRKAGGSVYCIRVIHGYHSGTTLRDMLRCDYACHPKVRRLAARGDGTTDLVLREL